MLTADLIQLTLAGDKIIGIVSSDDDLWPGIMSSLLRGATLLHIHTKPGWRTAGHYLTTLGSNSPRYIQSNV
jgi:hypothetical protein